MKILVVKTPGGFVPWPPGTPIVKGDLLQPIEIDINNLGTNVAKLKRIAAILQEDD